MLTLNPLITLVVVVLTPVSLLVARFIARRTYSMFRLQSVTRGEQTALIDETLGNQKLVRAFCREHGVKNELHYLRIDGQEWERRIRTRNAKHGEDPSSYFVDEGLLRKVESLFCEPEEGEADVIVEIGREN